MKDNLAEKKYYSELLDYYGRLLTNPQKQIMSDYFLCDLSLSEIAEERHVSRTAILDAIQKSSKKLVAVESKLGLLKIFKEGKEKANPQVLFALNELEGKIKNGI